MIELSEMKPNISLHLFYNGTIAEQRDAYRKFIWDSPNIWMDIATRDSAEELCTMAWLNYAKCRDKVDTWVILMVELVQSLRECQWICNQFRDWIVKFVVEEFEDSWYSLKTNYITYTREEYGPVLDCRVLAIADLLADTFSHGLIPIEEMGSALLLLAKKCSRYEHVHVMHILLYRGQIRYSQEPLPRALLNKCRRALQEDLPEPEYFFLDSMEYSRLTLEVVEEIDYLLHYTDCDNSKAVIEGLN